MHSSKSQTTAFFWFVGNHHLIGDPFGVSLLLRRVADLYSTRIDGVTRKHEPSTSWPEFLADEEEYRLSTRCGRDQRYWLDRLEHRPAAVTLSGQPPGWPGAVIETQGQISRSTVTALEALAAANESTLLAVFSAVTAACTCPGWPGLGM